MAAQKRSYEVLCYEALAVARAYIKREAPYYSTIVYGLVPHFIEGFGTLGVSPGMSLIIDPKWFVEMEKETAHITGMKKDEATYKMQAGVLVHEAGHILRGLERLDAAEKAGVDRGTLNKAFDIPINDDITATGWLLPAWAIFSSTYGFPKGLTGEQYIELMQQMQEKQPEKLAQINLRLGGGGKDGDGKEQGQVCGGRCGGCGGNGDKEAEAKADAETGRSQADKQRIRKEALAQVRDAAAAGRGSIPNSLKELLAKSAQKSVVPWEQRIQRVLRRTTGRIEAGRMDFSLRRPSKRSWTRGIMRPGMIDRKPEVALFEDSSGSMGRAQLISVRTEIRGVFTSLGISDAWFCDIDAAVAIDPRRIRLRDLDSLPVHGRGGTDFRPGIELAQTLVPRPDIVIYYTDGDGTAPRYPPKNMVVIWCIVPTPYGRRPAKWGELVLVSNDQELMEPYEHWSDDDDDDDDEE